MSESNSGQTWATVRESIDVDTLERTKTWASGRRLTLAESQIHGALRDFLLIVAELERTNACLEAYEQLLPTGAAKLLRSTRPRDHLKEALLRALRGMGEEISVRTLVEFIHRAEEGP